MQMCEEILQVDVPDHALLPVFAMMITIEIN